MKREVRFPLVRIKDERLEIDYWRRERDFERQRALLAIGALCCVVLGGLFVWLWGGW